VQRRFCRISVKGVPQGTLTEGYIFHPISNAAAEGFNSKIQNIKASARGFRNFDNFRYAILFYCGKLDLIPARFNLPQKS